MVIYDAHVTHGYAFREIADYLRDHYEKKRGRFYFLIQGGRNMRSVPS